MRFRRLLKGSRSAGSFTRNRAFPFLLLLILIFFVFVVVFFVLARVELKEIMEDVMDEDYKEG